MRALILTLLVLLTTACATDRRNTVDRVEPAPSQPPIAREQPAPQPQIRSQNRPVPRQARNQQAALPKPGTPASVQIASSIEGLPIHHRTLGSGPLTVLLIGLIHGSEPEGHARFDDLWDALDSPSIRRTATIHAIPSMNPDGHAIRSRYNANGVDLNRNWPASNFSPSTRRGPQPLSEPETRAVHGLLESISPDLLVVFHSAGNGPFVDPDGPALEEATAFANAAVREDPRWRPLPDYTNPPGSLGTYAGLDQGIPTLTVEFDRGHDPETAMRSALAGLRAAIRQAAARSSTK